MSLVEPEIVHLPGIATQASAGRKGGPGPGSAPPAREAAPPYLRIEAITKRFGAFLALRDISLEIFEGEFVCFLGPSGCGKTTLLRAIAGLDLQSEGRIFQDGRDMSWLPPSERDFGIVFQSYALFPNLTVAANVAYGLDSTGMPRARKRERVHELLELVGMPDAGPKYPAQLSGGQQQRVALARAIATSPGLLLLDEPLSALDARVRLHLRREIKRLQRRLGVTTIMVTHDQDEALTMADRIVVMRKGRIEQVGTPTEIYCEPGNAFVADFIGKMNFVPGKITAAGRIRCGAVELIGPADLEAFPSGTEIAMAVRPEDVAVRAVSESAPNVIGVRVAEMEFRGSLVRAELAADGFNLVGEFSINAVRDLDLTEGAELRVSLPPERLRIFPRDHAGED